MSAVCLLAVGLSFLRLCGVCSFVSVSRGFFLLFCFGSLVVAPRLLFPDFVFVFVLGGDGHAKIAGGDPKVANLAESHVSSLCHPLW